MKHILPSVKRIIGSICLFASFLVVQAQVPVTALNTPYTQNFNTLANIGTDSIVPAGWVFAESGINANSRYTAGTGSGNGGDTYSFGISGATERAFGGLLSGSLTPNIGAGFVNNTGGIIKSLTVTYTGEQWRLGAASRTAPDRLDFQYSTNATALAAGTWTNLDALDFNAPVTAGTVGALDGNAAANRQTLTFTLTEISLPAGATLWFRWTDFNVSGSDDGLAVDDFSLVANGEAPASSISVSASTLNFGGVGLNGSAVRSLTVAGNNLAANVTATVFGAGFAVSKDTVLFGTTLSFTAAELATAQKVYVRFSPAAIGPAAGNITFSSVGVADQTVTLGGTATNPFAQDFNACASALPGGWTQFSAAGDQTWACTTFGRTGNGVQVNGFVTGTGAVANQDWLISPRLSLTGFNFPLLSFASRVRFDGPSLKLLVSTNYSGSGNPAAATWAELNGQFPAANSDVWTQASNINLAAFKQPGVYVAFVYASSPEAGAARWTLDDFTIINADVLPPPPPPSLSTSLTPLSDFNFEGLAANVPSAAKTFGFSLLNATDSLTVSVPAPFQVSKDGAAFFGSVTYTAAQASVSNTLFVRALPTTEGTFAGRIGFVSGPLANTQSYLTASSISKDQTFDVVTMNAEWFGHPSLGPTNNNLQAANIRTVVQRLDADVYAFQEISNPKLFADSVAGQLPGYQWISSSRVSSGGDTVFAQRVGFLYKTSTVTKLAATPLLAGTDTSALAGYPVPDKRRFWASGRLPFLLDAQVNIGGLSKRVVLVNIHARANSADALNAYNMRKYDVKVLKDTLDRYYANVPLILLGDYNDDVDSAVASIPPPLVSSYQPYTNDPANYRTVTRTLSEAGLRSFIAQSNVIDHISITNELFEEHLDGSSRIEYPLGYVTNYQNTTTDHLPVTTRFKLLPPPVTNAAVRPVLECVVRNANGSFTAQFGYKNENTVNTTIPVGLNNRFVPTVPGQEQPTVFLPGRQVNAFSVPLKFGVAVWLLRGPDGRLRTATASIFSKRCGSGRLDAGSDEMFEGVKRPVIAYPNPFSDKVAIELSENTVDQVRIRLFDATGKEHQFRKTTLGAYGAELDLRLLPAGLYLIRVESAGKAETLRIVKQ